MMPPYGKRLAVEYCEAVQRKWCTMGPSDPVAINAPPAIADTAATPAARENTPVHRRTKKAQANIGASTSSTGGVTQAA